ncbi:hypothetical protein [Streptodolium elevatio]|uniref:Integral membrane protein n=1 Tax=Streptodolium elevatio TaxID=3157996 RepID=A0ABV3DZ89_9ACTN
MDRSGEFTTELSKLERVLLSGAVDLLPVEDRDRYREEWTLDLMLETGQAARLRAARSNYTAAVRLTAAVMTPRRVAKNVGSFVLSILYLGIFFVLFSVVIGVASVLGLILTAPAPGGGVVPGLAFILAFGLPIGVALLAVAANVLYAEFVRPEQQLREVADALLSGARPASPPPPPDGWWPWYTRQRPARFRNSTAPEGDQDTWRPETLRDWSAVAACITGCLVGFLFYFGLLIVYADRLFMLWISDGQHFGAVQADQPYLPSALMTMCAITVGVALVKLACSEAAAMLFSALGYALGQAVALLILLTRYAARACAPLHRKTVVTARLWIDHAWRWEPWRAAYGTEQAFRRARRASWRASHTSMLAEFDAHAMRRACARQAAADLLAATRARTETTRGDG